MRGFGGLAYAYGLGSGGGFGVATNHSQEEHTMSHLMITGTVLDDSITAPEPKKGKKAYARFRIAYRNGDFGGTNYVTVKTFGEEANVVREQLTHGTRVELIGHLESSTWIKDEGKKSERKMYDLYMVATYIKAIDGALVPGQADDTAAVA